MDNYVLDFGYFRLAKNIAKYSDHRVKVGCVLAKKKPISAASNKAKTHPKYSSEDHPSTHAEIRAIINCGMDDIRGADAYVYREFKSGRPALAKPCWACIEVMRESGIRRVFYSTGNFDGFGVIYL